jgi:nicotinamide-nucleotide amidase
MELELVTVGTELLLGFTLDSNAAELGRTLSPEGFRVVRSCTVADNHCDIKHAVGTALERAGFVIVTGGLGPTRDDVTKKAVADLYDAPLELNPKYLEALRRRFAKLGRGPMPESNASQAAVPRGAEMLPNSRGTAPGLWLEGEPGTVVLLPGVPEEMRGILRREVVPRLRQLAATAASAVTQSLVLRTTGISESKLADTLEGIDEELLGVTLAFLPGLDGTDLRLTAWGVPALEAVSRLDAAAATLRPLLRENLYAEGNVELVEVLLDRLRAIGCRLAVAESCTGGLVGAKLTSIPGSSEVFVGGVICYGNESKVRDLGVPDSVLEERGAVSTAVAEAMAYGVSRRFDTEAAVAITGVAGPGGGSPDKPVGTVCFAARIEGRSHSVTRWFPGGRNAVRHRSAQMALDLLRRMMPEL